MKVFTEHPAQVGETYGQHCSHASSFGVSMVLGGLACLVHALLPFCFLTTGSSIISRLYERMVVSRHHSPPAAASGGRSTPGAGGQISPQRS